MTMVQPTIKKNVIKKRTKKFIRFQSDQFKRVKVTTCCVVVINFNIPATSPTGENQEVSTTDAEESSEEIDCCQVSALETTNQPDS